MCNGLSGVSAQMYLAGSGVHLGNPVGISFKFFFTESDAFEGLLAKSWQGYQLTGLYQKHFVFPDPKLRHSHWYLGGGAHGGYWDNHAPFIDGPGSVLAFGVDLVAGIESSFGDYPFTFGFNWIPSVNLTGQFGINIFQIGLTGRYIF